MKYDFYKVLQDEFSASNAFDNVSEIHSRDRWISYDKFAESAMWCEAKMRENRLAEVEVNELKADGASVYGDGKVPPAWCARSATLSFPNGEVLCDYQKIPCSLSMYSSATPVGGIDAEVVVVEDLASPPPLDELRGRLILTSRPSGSATDLAVKSGAVGILNDYFPLFPGVRDSRDEMRGVHRWDCMSRRKDAKLFAFSLAPEQGDMLREMSKRGEKIVLHAEVDAGDCEGSLYVISGAVLGSDPTAPEIILYGHLDEPGANDNASGCGGLLELGRALTEAIESGRLERPKNTIRIVLGPEYHGSMGYIHYHPDRPRLALLAADMIGNETLDRTHITVTLDPLSNYSYADAAILLANRRFDEFSGNTHLCDTEPFWAGSDNYVADPSLETPALGYMNYPAQSYHSSLDTMERIEPEILKRNTLIVGDFAYILATADTEVCDELAVEIKKLCDKLTADAKTPRRLTLCKETYARALHSLKRLVPDYETGVPLVETHEEMPDYASALGADRVPTRIVKGPLRFATYPGVGRTGALNLNHSTPLQWTDGKRNIWDITIKSAAETGHDSDEEIKALLEKHVKMFEALAEFGYTGWAE